MASGTNVSLCPACKLEVKECTEILNCDGFCKKSYHITCANVSSAEFKKIKAIQKKTKWFCEPCDSNLEPVLSKISNVEEFLGLNFIVGKLTTAVNSLITANSDINQKLSDILSENQRLGSAASSASVVARKQESGLPPRNQPKRKTVDPKITPPQPRQGEVLTQIGNFASSVGNPSAARDYGGTESSAVTDSDGVNKYAAALKRNKPIIGTRKEELTAESNLKTVERKFVLFVSRIHPDVTKEGVEEYLTKAKIGGVECEKLNARYSSYNSFKVALPSAFVDTVLDPDFWPAGVLVKKFVSRRNHTGLDRPNPVYSRTFLARENRTH